MSLVDRIGGMTAREKIQQQAEESQREIEIQLLRHALIESKDEYIQLQKEMKEIVQKQNETIQTLASEISVIKENVTASNKNTVEALQKTIHTACSSGISDVANTTAAVKKEVNNIVAAVYDRTNAIGTMQYIWTGGIVLLALFNFYFMFKFGSISTKIDAINDAIYILTHSH